MTSVRFTMIVTTIWLKKMVVLLQMNHRRVARHDPILVITAAFPEALTVMRDRGTNS